jgi:hypothetical protein
MKKKTQDKESVNKNVRGLKLLCFLSILINLIRIKKTQNSISSEKEFYTKTINQQKKSNWTSIFIAIGMALIAIIGMIVNTNILKDSIIDNKQYYDKTIDSLYTPKIGVQILETNKSWDYFNEPYAQWINDTDATLITQNYSKNINGTKVKVSKPVLVNATIGQEKINVSNMTLYQIPVYMEIINLGQVVFAIKNIYIKDTCGTTEFEEIMNLDPYDPYVTFNKPPLKIRTSIYINKNKFNPPCNVSFRIEYGENSEINQTFNLVDSKEKSSDEIRGKGLPT